MSLVHPIAVLIIHDFLSQSYSRPLAHVMDRDVEALSTVYGTIKHRNAEGKYEMINEESGRHHDATENTQRRMLKELKTIKTTLIVIAILLGLFVVGAFIAAIVVYNPVQTTMGAITEMSQEVTQVGRRGEQIADQLDGLLASAQDEDGSYDLSALTSLVFDNDSDEGSGGFMSNLLGGLFGNGDDNPLQMLGPVVHRVVNVTLTALDYLDELDADDVQTMKQILPHALETLRYADEHHLLQQSLQMLEFASRTIARVRRLELDIPDEDLKKMPLMLHEMQIAIDDLTQMLERFQEEGIHVAL